MERQLGGLDEQEGGLQEQLQAERRAREQAERLAAGGEKQRKAAEHALNLLRVRNCIY